jgi:hypothetical protein
LGGLKPAPEPLWTRVRCGDGVRMAAGGAGREIAKR